jgi:hypothetical protein
VPLPVKMNLPGSEPETYGRRAIIPGSVDTEGNVIAVRYEQFPQPAVTPAPEGQFQGPDGEGRRDRKWQPEP